MDIIRDLCRPIYYFQLAKSGYAAVNWQYLVFSSLYFVYHSIDNP